jgi:hypothetical protein
MPSERAKENKALVATCEACGKNFSAEVMVSLSGCESGRSRSHSVCIACADGGWRPPGFSGIYLFRPR